ncbi:uncharacterized protein LOC126761729 [Bactrocera neohumeralis]|uniref:uncharacterized protein LOC120777705 n=1 Tax=Bactrocera tryoni TaxID=59916 RepID=UPI001A98F0DD|nr:uncharacterized protein LOC120777705 [Bactrocera tryoni]XP_050334064.1 uncharacterized protein LOC126761729 [Bactrocera neohumeralis]
MAPRHKKKNSLNDRLELVRKHNTSAAEVILQSSSQSKIENTPLRKDNVSQKQTPELEQLIPDGCVCHREAKTFVCIFCKMFSFGRIAEMCSIHPNVSYLMDFTCCPYCSGPSEHLHMVNMEYERYFKT